MAAILPMTWGMTLTRSFVRKVFAVVLLASCAAGPRSRPESAQRVPDSAPDKIAAQRAAAGLHLEEDDERWGIAAARERRQRAEPKKSTPPIPPVGPGPVDVQSSVDAGLR